MTKIWILLAIVLVSISVGFFSLNDAEVNAAETTDVVTLKVEEAKKAEINWVEEYEEAVKKAKLEKKNIMLLITTNTCRWCRKLEATTLQDETVVSRLNKDYVSFHATRDFDDYPEHLEASGVPTTFFLDTNDKPIIRKVRGYWNVEDYLSFLDDVDYKLGRKTY